MVILGCGKQKWRKVDCTLSQRSCFKMLGKSSDGHGRRTIHGWRRNLRSCYFRPFSSKTNLFFNAFIQKLKFELSVRNLGISVIICSRMPSKMTKKSNISEQNGQYSLIMKVKIFYWKCLTVVICDWLKLAIFDGIPLFLLILMKPFLYNPVWLLFFL